MTEIPLRLQKLKRYGGFPVPVTVFVADNGVPDFKVTDSQAWSNVVQNKLCGLCGEKLGRYKFFIGGDKSLESHFFFDPAMHKDCAEYAASVCPFIVGAKGYSEHINGYENISILIDHNMPTEKPKRMGLYKCEDYTIIHSPANGFILHASEPLELINIARE